MSGPTEKRRRESAFVQKRERAKHEEWAREKHQRYIDAINAVANQLATDQQDQNTTERERAFREKLTIALLIATVATAGIGDGIFYFTMRDARTAADTAHTDNWKALQQAAGANEATNKEAESNRVESSRAWVGPVMATVDAVPTAGVPSNVKITWQNSGREPGKNLAYFGNPIIRTVADYNSQKLAPELNDYKVKCFRTPDVAGANVAYPTTGFSSYSLNVRFPENMITSGVAAGRDIMVVQGCFVYQTINQIHHSAFCVFYLANPPAPPGQPAKPPLLDMNYCTTGNDAD